MKKSIILVSILLIILLTGCSNGNEEEKKVSGKELVESRCTTCHSIELVKEASFDRKGWDSTIDKMIGRGARLDDKERKKVLDYLSK